MKGGAVCYLSARVDEPQQVTGDDSPIYPYVVVLWTRDGSGAPRPGGPASGRSAGTRSASGGRGEALGRNFTFRHTKNVLARIEEASASSPARGRRPLRSWSSRTSSPGCV